MRDYLTLGPTPCDEPCAQVGQDNYESRARFECRAYCHQLERQFPIPENIIAHFTTKTFPHDFGSYKEVCILYEDEDGPSVEFALKLEGNLPEHWDEEARKELASTIVKID